MPILIPRTVSPHCFRKLAAYSPSWLRAQARCRHDSAAADFLHPQTDLRGDATEHAPALRVRKHGFSALPVSPLMRGDGAKKNLRQSAEQHDALKEFQKEVAMNPYAQALATPVRFCNLTLARLPSHFLLPFTTTIENVPATTEGHLPKVKARIQPGRSADYNERTLAQSSYVANRQDLVRHLSRKRHWAALVTERQKVELASIAHRSAHAQKLVQDRWIWENQVDATVAMLERKIVMAVTRALKARGQNGRLSSPSEGDYALALVFASKNSGELGSEANVGSSGQVYELTTLLSPESFSILTSELAQDETGTVYIAKTPEACQAQLALSRLKAFREANEIQKDLPQAQNPEGTREARARKYSELGARSDDEARNE